MLPPTAQERLAPASRRLLALLALACACAVAAGIPGCEDDKGARPPRVDAFPGCPAEVDGGAGGAAGDDAGGSPDGGALDGPAMAADAADAAATDAPGIDADPPDAPLPPPAVLGGSGPKVLLISIDGLRPDGLIEAPAVNILNLTCRGAHSFEAKTISPSLTLPSHASMVSGFEPVVHGLVWNDWRPGYIPTPTVFQAAHQAGLRTVMVVGKEKLQQLAIPGTVDTYVYAPGGDSDVASNAVIEIERGFDLMFVHFGAVDLTGHALAWMSDSYLREVIEADTAVGRLLAVLPRDTTVIISADHGGKGYNHFAGEPEDVTIPWIITGPRVRRGHKITAPISTTDTAATIAHLLGLPLPPGGVGRPVFDALLLP